MKAIRSAIVAYAAMFLLTIASTLSGATPLPPDEKYLLQQQINALKAKVRGDALEPVKLMTPVPVLETFKKMDSAAAETELKKKVEKNTEDDAARTLLRKYGFAVNLGYGYFSDLKNYAPDVQVRYNFIQRRTITEAIEQAKHEAVSPTTLRTSQKFVGTKLTDISGWMGYPLEKLENRERRSAKGSIIAAGTAKEAPIVVGVGVGFGGGAEFSSAVCFNAGVALFKNEAFKRNQFYFGVSVDAVLFKTITKALASAASD